MMGRSKCLHAVALGKNRLNPRRNSTKHVEQQAREVAHSVQSL